MTDHTLCRHCLIRKGLHGQAANPHRPFACPASEQDPKFPHAMADRDLPRAQKLYAKRLASHWTKRSTSFEAV